MLFKLNMKKLSKEEQLNTKSKNKISNAEKKAIAKKEKAFNKAKLELINKFNEIAYELGLYNKFNKTYKLDILEEKNYGYIAKIYLAIGLNFSDLDRHKTTIQQNLNCLLIMDYQSNSDCAVAKIITKPIDTTVKYFNPCIKANEIFLGMSYSIEPIIYDCNKYCMFLLAGATGAGKTRLIYMILLSWILSKENRNIELYISDVAKREFGNFKNIRCVRQYADELDTLLDIVKYLYTKISYRTGIIEPYRKKGKATNIEEFNKLKGVEKMTYNYLLIDELSILMPDKSDSKNEKKIKEEILSYLKKISKLGRGVGIFAFMCTQKTTRDEIPSIVKNMSAVRISFRANDAISSEVIMGNNSAVGLMNRLAVYSLNGGSKQDFLFSPSLPTSKLNEFLQPYQDANYSKANLKLMIKEMEQLEQKRIGNKQNAKENTSSSVRSNIESNFNTKREVVSDLPYDIILHDDKIVREDKKIDYSKTEKPRKKAHEIKDGWWLLK